MSMRGDKPLKSVNLWSIRSNVSVEPFVFVGGKLLFLSLAFAIPLALHPIWAVAAIYLVTTVVLGIVLAVVFQLAHCVDTAEFAEMRLRAERAGPPVRPAPSLALACPSNRPTNSATSPGRRTGPRTPAANASVVSGSSVVSVAPSLAIAPPLD
jgi:hypothetical protein